MSAGDPGPVTELSGYRERRPPGLVAGAERAWRLPDALPAAPPTGTVTFLLTDIEGSTRRWESHRDAMSAAVGRHYEILDVAVLRHGGIRPVEQGEGDSMVAAFSRASDAVAAALDAQRAFTAETWPDGADIAVRMAVHTGEALLREGLYYVGPSIIRCARLRALAHGGQVLVSTTAADLLVDGLPPEAALLPLGVHRLKDLRETERVFQLAHPGLRTQFPPLRSLEAQPHNLPVQLTSFVGRTAELAELADLTTRHRLVTLVGPGGSGKTRLAAQAAGETFDDHPDGVWWVDLSAVMDPARVPEAVLAAIGLDAKSGDPATRLTGYMAGRRARLVVDNCEHVVDAAADLIDAVRRGCPDVSVLATSREPLAIAGETVWRAQPLSLPPTGDGLTLDQLVDSEAVQLFAERATQAHPGFVLDSATAPVVAAIVARLDGMPLALELAAARVRSLTPDRLLASLDHRFRVLTGGSRTAQPRQQTLAASVEWSYDLLTEPQRVLLRRLSVFPGSYDLGAAEAVAAGGDLEGWEVLTLVSDLVDRSLVVFDGACYRLLQTIREFAAERLEASGETAPMRDAHLAHFADVARACAAELEAGPQLATLDRLEAARENILAAIDHALATAAHSTALRLCGDMTLFWQIHGRHSESLATIRRVLAATPDDAALERARALWAAGQLGFYTMDMPGGYGFSESGAAAEMARALGCDEVLGRALGMQSFVISLSNPAAGRPGFAEALAAAERCGDPCGSVAAHFYAAFGWAFSSDRPDLAAPHLDRVGAAAAATGSPLWTIWHRWISAITAWRAGRLAHAAEVLSAADQLAWATGDPVFESWCSIWLAEAYLALGEPAAAEGVIARSASWMDRSSLGRLELVLSRRVVMAVAQGDTAGAREVLAAIEGPARSMGLPFLTLELDTLCGRIALEEGDLDTARTHLAAAAAIAEALGTPWYAVALAGLGGRIARAAGDLAAAEDAHDRALALCVARGFRGVAAEVLENLASLACAGESHAEAVRLLGAADALREATGHCRWPVDVPAYDRDLAAVHAALGEDAFSSAWAEGRALLLPEAAAYATRARGERKRPSRGWDALTPTELEVVALAVGGLTNAQIGKRLFITAGTAKVHLSHIYAKLNVANRTQLAVQAAARGIGSPD